MCMEETGDWQQIDTDEGFRSASRVWKSIAFRYKTGPLVKRINRRVIQQTQESNYDLIWVDKGVYLWKETVKHLRSRAKRMVHFTPDTAFCANRSRHFFAGAKDYDLLVTTKSFEIPDYSKIADKERVQLVTQAYDANLHHPLDDGEEKKPVAAFIGLCEPDREQCIDALLSAGIPVRVGGRGWGKFARANESNPNFHFLGPDVFGESYVREYTNASVGLGLLSRKFPELHTTRTFEIPACGTMLATERNEETARFFDDDECLFFTSYEELAVRLRDMLDSPQQISQIAEKGRQRVTEMGCDNYSVLSRVLKRAQVF